MSLASPEFVGERVSSIPKVSVAVHMTGQPSKEQANHGKLARERGKDSHTV
jgi:hypothetical protein